MCFELDYRKKTRLFKSVSDPLKISQEVQFVVSIEKLDPFLIWLAKSYLEPISQLVAGGRVFDSQRLDDSNSRKHETRHCYTSPGNVAAELTVGSSAQRGALAAGTAVFGDIRLMSETSRHRKAQALGQTGTNSLQNGSSELQRQRGRPSVY